MTFGQINTLIKLLPTSSEFGQATPTLSSHTAKASSAEGLALVLSIQRPISTFLTQLQFDTALESCEDLHQRLLSAGRTKVSEMVAHCFLDSRDQIMRFSRQLQTVGAGEQIIRLPQKGQIGGTSQ